VPTGYYTMREAIIREQEAESLLRDRRRPRRAGTWRKVRRAVVVMLALGSALLLAAPSRAAHSAMTSVGAISAKWLSDQCKVPKERQITSPEESICIMYLRGFTEALESPPLKLEGNKFCLDGVPTQNIEASFLRSMAKAEARSTPEEIAKMPASLMVYVSVVQDYPCKASAQQE
jgi:hypothetical protein